MSSSLLSTVACSSSSSSAERWAIVTGANTGIGFWTCVGLVRAGYKVILACRSEAKAKEAIQRLNKIVVADNKGGDDDEERAVFLCPLDLMDICSVSNFVSTFLATKRPLHVLVNNAGVNSNCDPKLTVDGFDPVFQSNFLSHFYLQRLLLPSLQTAAKSAISSSSSSDNEVVRVVNVSSVMHHVVMGYPSSTAMRDVAATRSHPRSYSSSKYFQLVTGNHFHRLNFTAHDGRVAFFNVSPGAVASDIWRSSNAIFKFIFPLTMLTPEQGSQSTVAAATTAKPELVDGSACPYITAYKVHSFLPYVLSEIWQPSFFALPQLARARRDTYDAALCKHAFDEAEQILASALDRAKTRQPNILIPVTLPTLSKQ